MWKKISVSIGETDSLIVDHFVFLEWISDNVDVVENIVNLPRSDKFETLFTFQRGWNAVISYPKLFVVVLIVFLLPETFSDTYNSQYWLLFHSNWEAHVNHRFWNQLCSEIVLDHHNSISFRGITIISERPTIKSDTLTHAQVWIKNPPRIFLGVPSLTAL